MALTEQEKIRYDRQLIIEAFGVDGQERYILNDGDKIELSVPIGGG